MIEDLFGEWLIFQTMSKVEYLEMKGEVQCIYAPDRAAWRVWLAEHHADYPNVWLVIFKKASGVPTITIGEAIDEAICFAWIDSKVNKRDADSYSQFFSKRNPKSNWSRVNKEKVARLEAAGLLAQPGLDMIAHAKATGTWTALDAVENLEVPDDLQAAFDRYPGSFEHWDAFPRSVKRAILEWIFNAKRAPTRAKRIEETASLAQDNVRANQWPR